jgi:hypothetical protein
MEKNRLFFPQEALDNWLSSRAADVSGAELRLRDPSQRFRLVEAVRVLVEVSGAEDPFDVCGRVKAVGDLLELGAELLGDSMIIAENAYQVVPGWLATPFGNPEPDAEVAFSAHANDAGLEARLSTFLTRHA